MKCHQYYDTFSEENLLVFSHAKPTATMQRCCVKWLKHCYVVPKLVWVFFSVLLCCSVFLGYSRLLLTDFTYFLGCVAVQLLGCC